MAPRKGGPPFRACLTTNRFPRERGIPCRRLIPFVLFSLLGIIVVGLRALAFVPWHLCLEEVLLLGDSLDPVNR